MVQNPPPNVQRIVPNLAYEDAPAAIEFLCRAFGFNEEMRMEMPDGRLGHAELTLHGDTLMLASAFPEAGLGSPKDLPHLHAQVSIYVDDVDAHHEAAVAAGAEIMEPPMDMFWGDRIYRAVDPEGHRWMFQQHVRDVPPEQMATALGGMDQQEQLEAIEPSAKND